MRFDADAALVELRNGEDIVDEAQQHVTVVHDDADNLLFFLRRAQHGQDVGEPHDGVQRGTYLVGHIRHENGFHTSRVVGPFRLQFQLLLFLNEVGNVAHDTVGAFQLTFAVEERHTVDIVPLQLLSFVEEGVHIGQVCSGNTEIVVEVDQSRTEGAVDEVLCQFLERHLFLRCAQTLVDCAGLVGKRCAEEAHVAGVHQVL